MALTSAIAYYGLQGVFPLTSAATTGSAIVGPGQTNVALPTTGQAWAVEIEVDGAGEVEINLETAAVTVTGSGTAQVETATAAGTITGSGNATVTVTGDDITGSPLAVSFAVLSGDTAADWAAKVRTALNATAAITDKYTVGGASTSITVTRTNPRYNDSTLNIALANGTCTGITEAATSANTTAGVNPARCVRLPGVTYAGDDAEGKDIAVFTNGIYGMLVICENIGEGAVITDGDSNVHSLMPGQVDGSFSPNGPMDRSSALTFTGYSGGYGKATLVVINA